MAKPFYIPAEENSSYNQVPNTPSQENSNTQTNQNGQGNFNPAQSPIVITQDALDRAVREAVSRVAGSGPFLFGQIGGNFGNPTPSSSGVSSTRSSIRFSRNHSFMRFPVPSTSAVSTSGISIHNVPFFVRSEFTRFSSTRLSMQSSPQSSFDNPPRRRANSLGSYESYVFHNDEEFLAWDQLYHQEQRDDESESEEHENKDEKKKPKNKLAGYVISALKFFIDQLSKK